MRDERKKTNRNERELRCCDEFGGDAGKFDDECCLPMFGGGQAFGEHICKLF